MKPSLIPSTLLLLPLLAACGAPEPTTGQAESGHTEVRARLVFGADWSVTQSGPLLAGTKAAVSFDHDRLATCRGEQGGVPQWGITGFFSLDGSEPKSFEVFSPNTPPNHEPTLTLSEPGALELWFQSSNRWGCSEWDSNYGNNYHFEVAPPRSFPTWVGNATSVVSRYTCGATAEPCPADYRPLADGVVFGTWARQRATIANLYFEAWEAGLTDWDNPELWRELDVQLHYRFGATAPFESVYVDFERRTDSNARYAVRLRDLDPLRGNTVVDPASCPSVPLSVTEDGAYVVTEAELYITINDVELRPAEGALYRVRFEDYRGLYEPCLD